jgi:flagellar biosynthesis GTPase FlhF
LLLLILVTFGIYSIIWQWKAANRIRDYGRRHNVATKTSGVSWFLWNTIGCMLFGLGPIIALAKFLKSMNMICRDAQVREEAAKVQAELDAKRAEEEARRAEEEARREEERAARDAANAAAQAAAIAEAVARAMAQANAANNAAAPAAAPVEEAPAAEEAPAEDAE